MDTFNEEVRVFLEKFEANANVGSPEEIVTQFADVILAADPSGARAMPSSVLLMANPSAEEAVCGYGEERYYAGIGGTDEAG